MSAWKNVRVEATCPTCDGRGETPTTPAPDSDRRLTCGPWYDDCHRCRSTGRVSVPASEWAEALATVEGVEQVGAYRWVHPDAEKPGHWGLMTPGVAINGQYERRTALILPASASTREDGQANG